MEAAPPPCPEGTLSTGTPRVTEMARDTTVPAGKPMELPGCKPGIPPHGWQTPSSHGHSGPCHRAQRVWIASPPVSWSGTEPAVRGKHQSLC